MLSAVIIGITSAFIYGAADFLGGLGSQRISPVRVTAISASVGLVLLWVAYLFIGGEWSWPAVARGGLSGITGALALVLLYACLAIGPMSILSPLTAVVSAIVPVTVGLLGGDRLGTTGYVAIVLALVAVVLVGFVREKTAVRPSAKGLVMAVGSGALIGCFLILLDSTPSDSGIVPLIMNRTVNATVMFSSVGVIALLARRRASHALALAGQSGSRIAPWRPEPQNRGWRPGIRFAIACGLVDTFANIGLLVGLRLGELSVVSVLTALYPAGTIVLAAIVLKERIAAVQYVGLALALVAGGLFALS
jgi:drug/metabolite transporter (DMT)-like permease